MSIQLSKADHLKKTHSTIEKLILNKVSALPQGFNQTRFIQNAMVVLQDTKGIEKVDPVSIARTLLKGAFLGLDFYQRECYAIPYGDQLNFQTDYKGERKLALLYCPRKIRDIFCKLVKEGDEYSETIVDGIQSVHFTPKPFSKAAVIGVFAVCYFEDGGMLIESMSLEEVFEVRDHYSKQPKGPAWTKSENQMVKKVCFRRLLKQIDIVFKTSDQDQAFEAGGDAEFENTVSEREPVPMPKEKIADATVVENEDALSDEDFMKMLNDTTALYRQLESGLDEKTKSSYQEFAEELPEVQEAELKFWHQALFHRVKAPKK